MNPRVRLPIRPGPNRRSEAANAASHHALFTKLDVLPGILSAGRWSCLNSGRPALRAGNPLDRLRWTLRRLRLVYASLDWVARAYRFGAPGRCPPLRHRPPWGGFDLGVGCACRVMACGSPCPLHARLGPVSLGGGGCTPGPTLRMAPLRGSAIAKPLRADGLPNLHGLALPDRASVLSQRSHFPRHLNPSLLAQP